MAMDYLIDQPCKVKDVLSLDGLISLIKQRNRGLTILEMMKRDGKSDEQALNATFKVQVVTPQGVQVKEQRVADLLNSTKKLDELRVYCNGCPANGGRAFGCYRSINYPISRKAEEWLAGVSGKAANSKGPGMLQLQFIVEQKMDGGPFSKMRADPRGTFFESKKPLEIPVTIGSGLFNKKTVNTDQVFNLLMGMGRMKGSHMKMLLLSSGGLSIVSEEPKAGSFQQMFKATDGNGKTSWWTYNLKDDEGDDASTHMLKEFFRSLFITYALGKDMLISP
jgi:hypothetical protein